jgi:hypothetical protein
MRKTRRAKNKPPTAETAPAARHSEAIRVPSRLVPRKREAEFEPKMVPKGLREFRGFDGKIDFPVHEKRGPPRAIDRSEVSGSAEAVGSALLQEVSNFCQQQFLFRWRLWLKGSGLLLGFKLIHHLDDHKEDKYNNEKVNDHVY